MFPLFPGRRCILKVFVDDVDVLVKCYKVALLHHAPSRLNVLNVSKVANDFAFIMCTVYRQVTKLIPFSDIGFVERCCEQRSQGHVRCAF